MISASCILVLLVGSLSFKPAPVAELSDQYTVLPLNAKPSELAKFAGGFGLPFVGSSNKWTRDLVEPADGAPDSPDSPLHFRLQANVSATEAAAARKNPAETQEFIKTRFATFNDWKILEVIRV